MIRLTLGKSGGVLRRRKGMRAVVFLVRVAVARWRSCRGRWECQVERDRLGRSRWEAFKQDREIVIYISLSVKGRKRVFQRCHSPSSRAQREC